MGMSLATADSHLTNGRPWYGTDDESKEYVDTTGEQRGSNISFQENVSPEQRNPKGNVNRIDTLKRADFKIEAGISKLDNATKQPFQKL